MTCHSKSTPQLAKPIEMRGQRAFLSADKGFGLPFGMISGDKAMLGIIRHLQKLTLIVSLTLYCICLMNNGYYIEGSDPLAWAPAWALLIFGWVGAAAGTYAWLANPALFFSWILMLRNKCAASLRAAIVAFLLMVSFLFQSTVISSEAPTYSRIIGYGVGFWLWISSAVVQITGCIALLTIRKQEKFDH